MGWVVHDEIGKLAARVVMKEAKWDYPEENVQWEAYQVDKSGRGMFSECNMWRICPKTGEERYFGTVEANKILLDNEICLSISCIAS